MQKNKSNCIRSHTLERLDFEQERTCIDCLNKFFLIKKDIRITNKSNTLAWVIIAPTPIMHISKLKLNKGEIGVERIGNMRCIQSPLAPGRARTFQLDTAFVYFTILFNCGEHWKIHLKDNLCNSMFFDINILQRHLDEEATHYDFIPDVR